MKARKRTIFIVDDHEVVRVGLVQFLDSQEDILVCGQAEDAASAIAFMNNNSPDAVVLDINLRGISGIDLIKAIKSRSPGIGIVALSMHSEKEIVRRALQAGAGAYVLKSEPINQVLEAIQKVLAGKTFVSESLRESLPDILVQQDEGLENFITLLTDREFDIFKCIGEGLNRQEIAQRMNIRTSTIGTYRDRIKSKLHMKSSGELVKFAVQWALKGK